jgi:hypothetical protein
MDISESESYIHTSMKTRKNLWMRCINLFKNYDEMYLENMESERKNRNTFLMKKKMILKKLKRNGIQTIFLDFNKT